MSPIIDPNAPQQVQIVVPIDALFQRFLDLAVAKAKRELELEAEIERLKSKGND